MKYLKKYKIFESVDTTTEDITEICYELTDAPSRFAIKIYGDNEFTGWGVIPGSGMNVPSLVDGDKILFITLSNYMDYDGFSFDEVREVVLRLIDYLGDKYKGCSVLPVGEVKRSNINKSEIFEHNPRLHEWWFGNLTNLVIIYK